MKLLGLTSALALILISAPALAAQTGMGPNCSAAYEKYRASSGPKAFARGKDKGCGYAFGTPTLADAKKRATGFCTGNGGANCRVVESVQ